VSISSMDKSSMYITKSKNRPRRKYYVSMGLAGHHDCLNKNQKWKCNGCPGNGWELLSETRRNI
jgi:hypothetical protein